MGYKYILYFQNTKGEKRLISGVNSENEALAIIEQFLESHNFKSYYSRTWTDEHGSKWYDVGSHTEFFVLVNNSTHKIEREG